MWERRNAKPGMCTQFCKSGCELAENYLICDSNIPIPRGCVPKIPGTQECGNAKPGTRTHLCKSGRELAENYWICYSNIPVKWIWIMGWVIFKPSGGLSDVTPTSAPIGVRTLAAGEPPWAGQGFPPQGLPPSIEVAELVALSGLLVSEMLKRSVEESRESCMLQPGLLQVAASVVCDSVIG